MDCIDINLWSSYGPTYWPICEAKFQSIKAFWVQLNFQNIKTYYCSQYNPGHLDDSKPYKILKILSPLYFIALYLCLMVIDDGKWCCLYSGKVSVLGFPLPVVVLYESLYIYIYIYLILLPNGLKVPLTT